MLGPSALVLASIAFASPLPASPEAAYEQAIDDLLDGDEHALDLLRDAGQPGLDALIATYHRKTRTHRGVTDVPDETWQAWIDEVAAQRYAASSGLFWHTDLESAKAQAAETGKPILSLRMLGDLRDEYSCANSRLFRVLLYADPDVAETMRDTFVLHWSSERPVPVMTVDMGDGRVFKTTVTGNSAHYVLDADGRPVDVLPGLSAPDTFIAELERASALHDTVLDAPDRATALTAGHTGHFDERSQFIRGVAGLAGLSTAGLVDGMRATATENQPLAAVSVVQLAVTKSKMERPLVAAADPIPRTRDDWQPKITALASTRPVELSPESLSLLTEIEGTRGWEAGLPAMVSQDDIWNQVLHARADDWIRQNPNASFDELNTWVYANLFGTPASDPWLGLRDATVPLVLPNRGLE